MATETKTDGSTPPPDPSRLRTSVTEALGEADTVAAGRVQQLRQIHLARASQLARVAADVKAQPGANDADVARAEAAVAAARAVSSQLGRMHRQLSTPEPDVPAKGWVIHGHVSIAAADEEPKPVSGFTVFLVDAAKNYQEAYGFAYTDTSGYFLLKYEGAAQSANESSAADLFLEVADLKARPVYLSPTPSTPVIGTAIYQDIVFREDEQLGKVPGTGRKTAKPKAKPKS